MDLHTAMDPAFVVPTEMIPVPKVVGLSLWQIEGASCVWCAVKAKVGLGPRLAVVDGELLQWWPKCCLRCVKREAGTTYDEHIRRCQICTPQVYCVEARALYALTLQAPASP